MVWPNEIIDPGFTGQRRYAGECDRLHAGQLALSREGAIDKDQPGRISRGTALVIFRREQVGVRQRDMAGIEAAILPQKVRDCAALARSQ
jgi:hypothetical protein